MPGQTISNENITTTIQFIANHQQKLFETLLLLVLFLIIKIIVNLTLNRVVTDTKKHYIFKRVCSYTLGFIFCIALILVWVSSADSIMPVLGLFSAGMAIAMHETIANLAGWIFIISRRPFDVEDRIEINGHKGDVIDIRAFQFSLLEVGGDRVGAEQSTGRVIHVPNGQVLRHEIINFNQDFNYVWDELQVLITFESNWQKAREIAADILNKHGEQFIKGATKEYSKAARKFFLKAGKLTPIVYTAVEANGVRLSLRLVIPPRQRRGIESAIWEDILSKLSTENDIDFAYPTTRFYSSKQEGKTLTVPLND